MTRSLALIVTAAFPFLIGCGGSTNGSLSGSVTVDGQPLKRGTVRLEPDGGAGTPAGGAVENGKYEIQDVKPGKYKLHVDGEPESSGPTRQEDVMKRSEAEHRAATKNPVPAGATGNDVEVTISGASQTQDVKLESPPAKKK